MNRQSMSTEYCQGYWLLIPPLTAEHVTLLALLHDVGSGVRIRGTKLLFPPSSWKTWVPPPPTQ